MFYVKLKSEKLFAFDINEAFKDIRLLKTFLKDVEHGRIIKDNKQGIIFIGNISIMPNFFIILDENDKYFTFKNVYSDENFLEKFERI